METVGTGAGELNLKIQIGSVKILTFTFRTYNSTTETYTDEDISTKTFSFFLRKYKGSRKKIFNLTNGNGITVPIYSTNQIEVRISSANTEGEEEGEYYWELRREDLDQPKLFGKAYLSYDA